MLIEDEEEESELSLVSSLDQDAASGDDHSKVRQRQRLIHDGDSDSSNDHNIYSFFHVCSANVIPVRIALQKK